MGGWEADRLLTHEIAAAAIRARFPSIDSDGLKHIGSGWEFDAYLTRDGWVFRFPRRAECAELIERERPIHEVVSRVLSPTVAVPRVELVGHPTSDFPYCFAGHRFVRGVAADSIDSSLLPTLARDLGAALGAMHSIPESVARAAGAQEAELNDTGRREWLEWGYATASRLRHLDPVVDEAVTWVGTSMDETIDFPKPPCLIHQDLAPDHVLVDPATGKLLGIIDWTDAMLGDAARDFVFAVTWQGWEFAELVLRSYPRSVDSGFRDRLRWMSQVLSVMWLGTAHEKGEDVTTHVQWVRNAFSVSDSA